MVFEAEGILHRDFQENDRQRKLKNMALLSICRGQFGERSCEL